MTRPITRVGYGNSPSGDQRLSRPLPHVRLLTFLCAVLALHSACLAAAEVLEYKWVIGTPQTFKVIDVQSMSMKSNAGDVNESLRAEYVLELLPKKALPIGTHEKHAKIRSLTRVSVRIPHVVLSFDDAFGTRTWDSTKDSPADHKDIRAAAPHGGQRHPLIDLAGVEFDIDITDRGRASRNYLRMPGNQVADSYASGMLTPLFQFIGPASTATPETTWECDQPGLDVLGMFLKQCRVASINGQVAQIDTTYHLTDVVKEATKNDREHNMDFSGSGGAIKFDVVSGEVSELIDSLIVRIGRNDATGQPVESRTLEKRLTMTRHVPAKPAEPTLQDSKETVAPSSDPLRNK